MKERLAVTRAHRGSDLHETGKRGENAADLPGVFEPVAVALSVSGSTRYYLPAVRRLRMRPDCRADGTDATVYSYPLPRAFSITFPEFRKHGVPQGP